MKLEILIDESAEDLHIQVTCKQLTSDIERIIASLRVLNRQLTAKKNGEIYFLDITQIIYIENVDRKSFIYTADDIFECDLRLYELEQQLEEFGFFRVSKSFLIYLPKIQSLRAEFDRKVRITMSNGEQIIASRQYADELKRKLGVK